MSEIDNPLFKSTWNALQTVQHRERQALGNIDEEVYTKMTALFKWAKSQNKSRQDAFNFMIDKDRGEVYNKLTKEFRQKYGAALETKDADYMKLIFRIKDEAKYKEYYAKARENQINYLMGTFFNLKV